MTPPLEDLLSCEERWQAAASRVIALEAENARLLALLQSDATARQRGLNLDGSVRRETVDAFLDECGSVFGGHIDIETRRRLVRGGLEAALREHGAKPDAGWKLISAGLPEPGHRFVALYDDGSGAFSAYRHDDGFIDQDGDDFVVLKNVDFWSYAPVGFQMYCEIAGDDPVQLPLDAAPPAPPREDAAAGGGVEIDYTNYRGERSIRRVEPRSIQFGATEWHPDPQWILHAFDLDKGAIRGFALKEIHSWGPPRDVGQATGAEPAVAALADEIERRIYEIKALISKHVWIKFDTEGGTGERIIAGTNDAAQAIAATLRTSAPPAHPSEATVEVRDVLTRIAKATPASTNNDTAEKMASWCRAVAHTGLDALDIEAQALQAATVAPPRETEPRPVEDRWQPIATAPPTDRDVLARALGATRFAYDVVRFMYGEPAGWRYSSPPTEWREIDPRPVEQTGSGDAEIERLTREREDAYKAIGKLCDEHTADLARVTAENERLRQIVSECAASLGNGAAVGPECSLEFMGHLPNEIRLYATELRARLTEAAAAGSDVAGLRAAQLPKLTDAMMRAACMAHYRTDNIDGVDLAFNGRDYSFRQAFRRMWNGVRAALAASPDAGAGREIKS